jgi:hypothetical protein
MGGRTAGTQAPVNDLSLVNGEAVVIRRGQAGCLADGAVDVSDNPARPADNVMVIVTHAPLKPRRVAGRLDAANESSRGERVQGLIYRLKGDMAYAIAHPSGDCLDAEMVASPDGLEQGDTSSRHPKAGTAQFRCGGRSLVRAHSPNLLP